MYLADTKLIADGKIEEIKEALKTLLQLKGGSYTWKSECQEQDSEHFDNKKHFGFIAQDVAKMFSNWISLGKIYKVGNEEIQALDIRISPTLFEFQSLTVEALREIDTRLRAAEESIKKMMEEETASCAAIGSTLADLQLRQLQQDDRIRKIEQKEGN